MFLSFTAIHLVERIVFLAIFPIDNLAEYFFAVPHQTPLPLLRINNGI